MGGGPEGVGLVDAGRSGAMEGGRTIVVVVWLMWVCGRGVGELEVLDICTLARRGGRCDPASLFELANCPRDD